MIFIKHQRTILLLYTKESGIIEKTFGRMLLEHLANWISKNQHRCGFAELLQIPLRGRTAYE